MREPIPIDPMARPRAETAPAYPDAKFIADLTLAIRGGSSPGAAARWLGLSRSTWRMWRTRQGEPYDTLRRETARAIAHLEVKLMNDLARKNPLGALHRLRAMPSGSPDHARHVARMAERKPWEKLGLTLAEELFCRQLLKDPNENAVEAVRQVGMFEAKTAGSLRTLASTLRKKPKIIARIGQLKAEVIMQHERKHRTKVSGQRIVEEYAAVGFADIRRFVTIDEHGMTMTGTADLSDEDAAAIQSVANTPEGMKFTLHNKLAALDKLAEMSGLTRGLTPFVGGVQIERAIVMIPDNHRDVLPGGSPTNGSPTAHRPPTDLAVIEFPPRDDTVNGDRHDNGNPGP